MQPTHEHRLPFLRICCSESLYFSMCGLAFLQQPGLRKKAPISFEQEGGKRGKFKKISSSNEKIIYVSNSVSQVEWQKKVEFWLYQCFEFWRAIYSLFRRNLLIVCRAQRVVCEITGILLLLLYSKRMPIFGKLKSLSYASCTCEHRWSCVLSFTLMVNLIVGIKITLSLEFFLVKQPAQQVSVY